MMTSHFEQISMEYWCDVMESMQEGNDLPSPARLYKKNEGTG